MKRRILEVAGICVGVLIILLIAAGTNEVNKIEHVVVDEENIGIAKPIVEASEDGVMKGYWNIALFGVDSREDELLKSTRTDTIIVASINLDTYEVRLVSVYRDTYLNIGDGKYNKANAAYAKGGANQAIKMLNTNLDMNITDFVTIGFKGVQDLIDAVDGVEIDVRESEISHLNNYQISMCGKVDEDNSEPGKEIYYATEGVDYTAVTKPGLQTLNGLQATAYCRIRYVGNDFARTKRQQEVIQQLTKKLSALNIASLNKITQTIFPETATSLDLDEVLKLLAGINKYYIGKTAGFPFDTLYTNETIKNMSCILPNTLEENVIMLHEFLFDEKDYHPTETIKEYKY